MSVTRLRRGGGRLNHSVSRLDRRRPGPGVFLFLSVTMKSVEQGRGRALSGSGCPLARTSAGLARMVFLAGIVIRLPAEARILDWHNAILELTNKLCVKFV